MPVETIPRTLFDQLHGGRQASTSAWLNEEIEWFAERSRVLIGYIARSIQSHESRFVVEGRDERGQFHPIETREHIPAEEDARALVEDSIRRLMATGQQVWPAR